MKELELVKIIGYSDNVFIGSIRRLVSIDLCVYVLWIFGIRDRFTIFGEQDNVALIPKRYILASSKRIT